MNTYGHASGRRSGFTLIELLTVIFIIGILIAILVPSLNAARRSAKSAATSATIRAVATGTEMFKNENEKDYSRTNGYPPSSAHPRLRDQNDQEFFDDADSAEGRYPYVQSGGTYPVAYGAQWIVTMLMGADLQGYVRPSSVPEKLAGKPEEWYLPDQNGELLPRNSLYLDPSKVQVVMTRDLPGTPPTRRSNNPSMFPDWDQNNFDDPAGKLQVITDSFDTPILYYAASRGASTRNLIEPDHLPGNDYSNMGGTPFYFHQDNRGFTGYEENHRAGEPSYPGWNFGGGGNHPLAWVGEDLKIDKIDEFQKTFAFFIHDEKAHDASEALYRSGNRNNLPLRARNGDSFILLSPGADGLYGTPDDVSNLAPNSR